MVHNSIELTIFLNTSNYYKLSFFTLALPRWVTHSTPRYINILLMYWQIFMWVNIPARLMPIHTYMLWIASVHYPDYPVSKYQLHIMQLAHCCVYVYTTFFMCLIWWMFVGIFRSILSLFLLMIAILAEFLKLLIIFYWIVWFLVRLEVSRRLHLTWSDLILFYSI